MGNKNKIIFVLIMISALILIFWGHQSNKNKIKKVGKEVKTEDVAKLQEWNDSDGEIYRNIEYTNGLTYNLYIPKDLDKSKEQSVILFLHGGSWESGSKDDVDQLYCKVFANAGYVTAAMDYSFVNSNGTITFDNILDEITACFTAINEKTTQLGITINSSAISGYSAGGHLALLYAYSRKEECPIPLKFTAVEAGPTDFHPDSWKGYSDEFLISSLFKYSGVKVKDLNSELTEKTINSISPLSYVNSKTIPTILAYGTADTTVNPIHYQKLVKQLDTFGIKYDLLEFKGAEHFLFVDTGMQLKYYAKVLEYADEYLK